MNFIEAMTRAFTGDPFPRRVRLDLPMPQRTDWSKVVDAEVRMMDAETRRIEALARLEEAKRANREEQP